MKNVTDRTAHFCRQILKTAFCRYRVNASSDVATVTFFTVFKMCRHRVNAVLVLLFRQQLLVAEAVKGFHQIILVTKYTVKTRV